MIVNQIKVAAVGVVDGETKTESALVVKATILKILEH